MRKELCLLALVGALSVGVASAEVSDQATLAAVEAFSAGQTALQANDLPKAITELEKALSFNPELFIAHYYLGKALLAKQDTAKGLEQLQLFVDKVGAGSSAEAIDAQRTVDGQKLQKIDALMKEKNWVEVTPLLKQAVEAKGNDVGMRRRLAMALLATKDEAGAEEQLVKLMELDPKGAPVFLQAGTIAYMRKDDAAARQRLDAFVALTPEGPQAQKAYLMLGKSAERAGDRPAAKGYYEKYLGTNPTGPAADAVRQNLANWDAIGAAGAPAPPPAE